MTQAEVEQGVELEWDRRYLAVLGVAGKRLYEFRLQVGRAPGGLTVAVQIFVWAGGGLPGCCAWRASACMSSACRWVPGCWLLGAGE